MTTLARRALRRLGFDIVRVPHPYTLEKHLSGLFAVLGVDCVLDVGANQGQYAQMLRRIGYSGWIVSFEPVPAIARLLQELSAKEARWEVQTLAIGSRREKRKIATYSDSQLNSFLEINPEAPHLGGKLRGQGVVDEVDVQIERLDALVPAIQERLGVTHFFLKSDTQGYDLQVLEGSSGVLDRVVGLQVEAALKPFYEGAPTFSDVIELVSTSGFSPSGFYPVSSNADGSLVEVDCVAVRVGGSGGVWPNP